RIHHAVDARPSKVETEEAVLEASRFNRRRIREDALNVRECAAQRGVLPFGWRGALVGRGVQAVHLSNSHEAKLDDLIGCRRGTVDLQTLRHRYAAIVEPP